MIGLRRDFDELMISHTTSADFQKAPDYIFHIPPIYAVDYTGISGQLQTVICFVPSQLNQFKVISSTFNPAPNSSGVQRAQDLNPLFLNHMGILSKAFHGTVSCANGGTIREVENAVAESTVDHTNTWFVDCSPW